MEGMCDLTNTIKPPLLSVISSIYGLIMLCTNWLLGKDSSDFVFAFYTISIFPSTILSKSPTLFLMELIFRYEKITLLGSECRERFKVTLIFSSYSWLMIDASIRGLIYLLNMRRTRSYFFKNTFAKILFSANRHQITYFLLSPKENEYVSIKCAINLKHPKKLLLMKMLTQRVEKQLWFIDLLFFAILKCLC